MIMGMYLNRWIICFLWSNVIIKCVCKFRLRRNELAAITTQTIFTGFYERLRAIREYHTKFPDTAATIFKNSDLVLERILYLVVLGLYQLNWGFLAMK